MLTKQSNTRRSIMMKISRYEDINLMENEAKKDYIDRHSPFIHCEKIAKKGEPFKVTVRMGDKYSHPDDLDHYISQITLFNRNKKLAEATFLSGALGGQDAKGNQTVTFNIVLDKAANLIAHSYCTKHGLWESETVDVNVE